METFSVKTSKLAEFIDITKVIRAIISKSGIISGICTVFVPHTTAGIIINENADPNVRGDILKELDKIVPHVDAYAHAEGNSAAHIKASIMGFSQSIIIEAGNLVFGTWQGIYFCEFDGPRARKVYVKIIKG